MKTKSAAPMVTAFLRILACGALIVGMRAGACTVFCHGQGDTVLAGRSFDIPDNPHLGMQVTTRTLKLDQWLLRVWLGWQ